MDNEDSQKIPEEVSTIRNTVRFNCPQINISNNIHQLATSENEKKGEGPPESTEPTDTPDRRKVIETVSWPDGVTEKSTFEFIEQEGFDIPCEPVSSDDEFLDKSSIPPELLKRSNRTSRQLIMNGPHQEKEVLHFSRHNESTPSCEHNTNKNINSNSTGTILRYDVQQRHLPLHEEKEEKYEEEEEEINEELNEIEEDFPLPLWVKPSAPFQSTDIQFSIPRQDILIQIKYEKANGDFAVMYYDEFDRDRIRSFIHKKMPEMGISCTLVFYSYHRNADSIVLYSRCKGLRKNPNHPTFRYYLEYLHSSRIIVSVYSRPRLDKTVMRSHKGQPMRKQSRGFERDILKEKLAHMSATELSDELISKLDPNLRDSGHFGNWQPVPVLQTMRNELRQKKRELRKRDVYDVMTRCDDSWKKNDPYVRQTGTPFFAIMYSAAQYFASVGQTIGYMDATGNVTRPTDEVTFKKIMLHMLAVNVFGVVLPILEMLSADQSTPAISYMLSKYKYFVCSELGKAFQLKTIVLDWCWASMNSVLNVLDLMDMEQYLQTTFDFATGKTLKLPSYFVSIQTCINHFQHRVARNIKKNFPELVAHKSLILNFTGLLARCQTLDKFLQMYRLIVTVFSTTDKKVADRAIADIRDNFQRVLMNENEDLEAAEMPREIREKDKKAKGKRTLASRSPYNKIANAILLQVQNIVPIDEAAKTNDLYQPAYASYLTEKYITFGSVWSAFILARIQGEGVAKLSNASIEGGGFSRIKNVVLKKHETTPAGDFLVEMERDKETLIRRINLQGVLRKANASENYQNEEKEAKWMKGRKRAKTNHLDGGALFNYGIEKKPEGLDDKQGAGKRRKRKAAQPKKNVLAEKVRDCEPMQKTCHMSDRIDCLMSEGIEDAVNLTTFSPVLSSTRRFTGGSECDKKVDGKKGADEKDKSSEANERVPENEELQLAPIVPSQPEELSQKSDSKDESYRKHPLAMPNCLFDDPEYYSMDSPYNVCVYPKVDLPELGRSTFRVLTSSDYARLVRKMQCEQETIDCYAVSRLSAKEWRDVLYVRPEITAMIVGDYAHKVKPSDWFGYKIPTNFKQTILMPVHVNGNHFVLFVADIEKEKLILMDSLDAKNYDLLQTLSNNFRKFVKECATANTNKYLSTIRWKLSLVEETYNMQSGDEKYPWDGVNCATMVCYYMDCLAMDQPVYQEDFDKWQFRSFVAHELLRRCPSMENVCLRCTSTKWSDSGAFQGYQCNGCYRWIHSICLDDKYRNVDLSNSTIPFHCLFCRHNKKYLK